MYKGHDYFLSATSFKLRITETNNVTVTVVSKSSFSAWLFSTNQLLNFPTGIINYFPKLPRIKQRIVLVWRAPLLQSIYKHRVSGKAAEICWYNL